MNDEQRGRLTDDELKVFFNRLFPTGVTAPDVLAEIAPEGWEKSPLLACFHPSAQQVFEEQLQVHRNIEEMVRIRREREPDNPELAPRTEPTLEGVRAEWKESPVNTAEEVAELMGQCLWDIFSDNHEVVADDGRVVDIGSFRGASAFLDEYVASASEAGREEGYMHYYMGSIWTSGRADLFPMYRMIFRRLKALGADWDYHFPELGIVDLSPAREEGGKPSDYSPSEAFAKEQEEKEHQAEIERVRSELAEIGQNARREALDRPEPPTVRAYQDIYGRDPNGWPPA
jgi:hypothetical protein